MGVTLGASLTNRKTQFSFANSEGDKVFPRGQAVSEWDGTHGMQRSPV